MDNYTANKIIVRRISNLIEKSQEVSFQKILMLSGVTNLFEIEQDSNSVFINGADIEETSYQTLNKLNTLVN